MYCCWPIYLRIFDSCITNYGLDPAYYYTLSGFTWDAMLKHTRVNFELLTDIDMVLFIELNTNFRTLAKNEFREKFIQISEQAIFDKTMENVRNHINVRLVMHWERQNQTFIVEAFFPRTWSR